MYEEALLPPSLWLTVDTHLMHKANGCNYPLDSSGISSDEHPQDEACNWMQKWGYCVENCITLSLGEEGNHDIETSKSQKQKRGGGREQRELFCSLLWAAHSRTSLRRAALNLSLCLPLVVPPPSFPTFNSASFAWLAWGICIYVIQASAEVTDGAITMRKQCSHTGTHRYHYWTIK